MGVTASFQSLCQRGLGSKPRMALPYLNRVLAVTPHSLFSLSFHAASTVKPALLRLLGLLRRGKRQGEMGQEWVAMGADRVLVGGGMGCGSPVSYFSYFIYMLVYLGLCGMRKGEDPQLYGLP